MIPSDKEGEDFTTAMVSSIPMREPNGDVDPGKYLLQRHDGTTLTKTLMEMDEIADLPANKKESIADPSHLAVNGVLVWLQHNCKVTFDHKGEFHKGFLKMGKDGNMHFSCRRQQSAKSKS